MKICYSCKIEKEERFFSKNPRSKDRLSYNCRECHNNRNKTYNRANPERSRLQAKRWNAENKDRAVSNTMIWRKNNPEKLLAHRIIFTGVRNGSIKKEKCCICGEEKTEAHHEDYTQPLKVLWLCRKHHKEKHKR